MKKHNSKKTTNKIAIEAHPYYLPDHPSRKEGEYIFSYRIKITNKSEKQVRIMGMSLTSIDANAEEEIISKEGLNGERPQLEPLESYEFTSYCKLNTYWGTLEGNLQILDDKGKDFDAAVARIYLTTTEDIKANA